MSETIENNPPKNTTWKTLPKLYAACSRNKTLSSESQVSTAVYFATLEESLFSIIF